VLVSLCYELLRWMLEFAGLRTRSSEFKELEIIVLRHELAILRRTRRVQRSPPLTGDCSRLPADCCRARVGNPSSSRRPPSCAGIDAWSPSAGRTRVRSVGRRCGKKLGILVARLAREIELGNRRVHIAGCTPNPSALWVRPAGSADVVDLGGARGTDAVSDSRSRSEIHRSLRRRVAQ
jgi:hypothetical protein